MDRTAADAGSLKERVAALMAHCQAYKGADVKHSIAQLIITMTLFFVAIAVMLADVCHGHYGLYALLMLPAAGLLVRLFVIQHDCGHGSFFNTRKGNDRVGLMLSLLTWTPYDFWRRSHNMHHAGSGNLDRRGLGSIDTLTVREYRALPFRGRLAYRLYRNPFLLLLVFTPLFVVIMQRLPPRLPSAFVSEFRSVPAKEAARSVYSLDAGLIVLYGGLIGMIGIIPMLLVFLPILVLTAWIGGWLFFIQHQFEETYWEYDGAWNFQEAALLGSSYYVLPRILQWFSGSIGLHHIHHFCSAIPNYRLQKCLDASPELQQMNRLTITQSLKCAFWALWDEQQRKMIGFGDLAKIPA